MVQRAASEAAGHRESRMGLGIGYASYQSGYNKLFTQVIKRHSCYCKSVFSLLFSLIYPIVD